ncbi:MAG: hypothetical protein RRY53_06100, partial [Pseudoflavonifractor sp.]
VKYGYLRQPEKPAVPETADPNGLWNIYKDLLAEYESVSQNYDTNYGGITWVDYTNGNFDSFAHYEAYKQALLGGGAANAAAAQGLVWTDWLTKDTSATTALTGKFLSGTAGNANHVDVYAGRDAVTMVKALVGHAVTPLGGTEAVVQGYNRYDLLMTRKNSDANYLNLYGLAQGTPSTEPSTTVGMTKLVDDTPETLPNGTQIFTFNFPVTAENDSYFDLWIERLYLGHALKELTLKVTQKGATAPHLTLVNNGSKTEIKLSGNNRLDINPLTSLWKDDDKAALQIVLDATAQSGEMNRYIVNVYRKSAVAELDMKDDAPGAVPADLQTTLGGKPNTEKDPVKPVPDDTDPTLMNYTYHFTVYTRDLTTAGGKTTVKANLYSIANAIGQRMGKITLPDGRTTGDVDLALDAYVSDQVEAHITGILVESEDGTKHSKYHFVLNIISSDTSVKSVQFNEAKTVPGEEAYVLSADGKPVRLTHSGEEQAQKILDLKA